MRSPVHVDEPAAKDTAASAGSCGRLQLSPADSTAPTTRSRVAARSSSPPPPPAMEWERNDTVRLIEEVRSRPCLWDNTSRSYTERLSRRDALAEVARTLGVSLLCVQKKWTNLRTQYFRERSRVQNIPGHSPRWFGFNMLRFLDDGPVSNYHRNGNVVVDPLDDDSRTESCWATSSVDCGSTSHDVDDVKIVVDKVCSRRSSSAETLDDDSRGSAPVEPTVELVEGSSSPERPTTPQPPPTPPPPQRRLRQQTQAQRLAMAHRQSPPRKPDTPQSSRQRTQAEPRATYSRKVRPPVASPTVDTATSPPHHSTSQTSQRGQKRRAEPVEVAAVSSNLVTTSYAVPVDVPMEPVSATLHDRLDMYGLHVASRLRHIRDPYLRTVAINKIDNALFEVVSAEMVGQRQQPVAAATTAMPQRADSPSVTVTRPPFHTVHVVGGYQHDQGGNVWANGPVVEEVDSKSENFMNLS